MGAAIGLREDFGSVQMRALAKLAAVAETLIPAILPR